MKRVQSGLDVLLARSSSRWRGVRVGLLCHQASVDCRHDFILHSFLRRRIEVSALYAPEHGLWGTAQDQIPIQRAAVSSSTAALQHGSTPSLPVFSLYGDHRAPSPEQLENIDVLVCDLQDVGARYYTFVWTMALAMQACAKAGKKFIVLDRPNPINGLDFEGPLLDLNFASFVGLYPVPVRHGLTIAEMALWLNSRFDIHADLEVVPMKGWRRAIWFDQTDLPWVYPSPNMPTLDTAIVYPGGCLIEGTNLSEGRGTTRPFELIGAPFIDGDILAKALNDEKLPGVVFRGCRFEPTFHKFKEQLCGGVQIHVTDRQTFKSFLAYLLLIQKTRELFSGFAWRDPPYEYETVKLPFDILCGTDTIRRAIEDGRDLRFLMKDWTADGRRFADERRDFLLYN